MQMRALKRIRKGGRYVEPGEMFEVRSSAEGKALRALGRAEVYVEPVAPPTPVVARTPPKAAEVAPAEEPEIKKVVPRYSRRDMQAEETP